MGDSERGEFLMWKVNIICRKPFDFAQDVADAPFFLREVIKMVRKHFLQCSRLRFAQMTAR